MSENEMRAVFATEQGAKIEFDTMPDSDACRVSISTTDGEAAVKAMALLIVRLAEEADISVERVLGLTTVTAMKICQRTGPTPDKA